jgi:hypothetical protein
MRSRVPFLAGGAVALAAVFLWPLTPALPASDAAGARAAAAVIAVIVCVALTALRKPSGGGPLRWFAAAAVTGVAAIAILAMHYQATGACVARYQSRSVVVGRALQPYVRPEPGATPDDLLFDAAGQPERVWLPDSIGRCRFLLGWAGLLAIPLALACACCLIAALPARRVLRGNPGVIPSSIAPVYDAFFSYRHAGPDRDFAIELLEKLERNGLRAAIDERDFRPNEHFLSEMERCIRQSRFILCVVTSQYLASDHCVEEAVISKTLDMGERKRRLVPLILERVEMPVWLHGIVGIDFTGTGATDPEKRLLGLLKESKTEHARLSPD